MITMNNLPTIIDNLFREKIVRSPGENSFKNTLPLGIRRNQKTAGKLERINRERKLFQ